MSAESNSDATKASHFGDYQYLHAMGAAGKDGSSRRHEIRGKMDRYIYHCVKMATDPDSYRRFGEAYDRVSQMISQEKSPGMEIDGPKYSRDELIVRKSIMLFPRDVLFFHATNQMEFQMRALGSCLHIIQDSYAMGHVVREGWEDGTNNGPIRYFQDYSQQDSEAHAFYDRMASSPLKEIKDFGIPGSNMAYQRTKKILELIKNGCPWTRQGKDDAEEELRDDEVNTESSKMGHCESDQSIYGFIRNTVFSFSKNDDAAGPFDKTQSHPDLVKKPELKQDNLYEGGG